MPSLYFGRFEERQTFLEDSGFVWLEVFDTFEQQTAWLQLLQPGAPLLYRQALEQFFSRINASSSTLSLFNSPHLLSDEINLGVIYQTCPVNQGLEQIRSYFESPQCATSCESIFEALHSAHRESIYFGYINPRLVTHSSEGLVLAGLGYSALLGVNPQLLASGEGQTLQKVGSKHRSSVAGDLASLAHFFKSIFNNFDQTSWYVRATQPMPRRGFRSARAAYKALKSELDTLELIGAMSDGGVSAYPASKGQSSETTPPNAHEIASDLLSAVPAYFQSVPFFVEETFKWSAVRPTLLRTLEGHRGWVMSLAFSSDGLTLLTGSTDRTTRLWNVSTGDVHLILQGHTDTVISVEFSLDGSKILTASRDHTIRLWDAHTGELLQVLVGHTQWIGAATFNRDGSKILTGSWDKTVRLWNTSSGCFVRTLMNGNSPFRAVAFNFDESKVFAAAQDNIEIRNVSSGELLDTLEGHTNWITSLSLNAQRTQMVTASWDGTARVWDARTGQALCVLLGHTDPVHSAVFSPDGSLVLTGSWDGTARGWDAQTGQSSFVLEGHQGGIQAVAFSRDGSRIITGSRDQTVKVWNVEKLT